MTDLPLHLQLSTIATSLILIFLIVRGVRHEWIQLKYSLIWLGIGFGILLFAIFPELGTLLAVTLGIDLPANALFFIAIIVILLLVFQLMLILSKTEEKQRLLAQRLAILELELEQTKHAFENWRESPK